MYNSNMSQIIIEGPEKAIIAGTWAEENITGDWRLEMNDPFSNYYHFIFSRPQDATYFSLRWKQ